MKTKKLLALLLVVVMTLSVVLVGCGNKQSDEDQTAEEAEEQAKDNDQKDQKDKNDEEKDTAYEGPKVIDYYLGDEPMSIDSQQVWGTIGMQVVNMYMEGLTRLGKEEGKLVPGVAKEWKHDPETNVYTFILNPDAKWADGTSVKPEDFFYGWIGDVH